MGKDDVLPSPPPPTFVFCKWPLKKQQQRKHKILAWVTLPCLSLSNEPIFLFLEDKATFDYEKYRRKFSIIGIGQLENSSRKLLYPTIAVI